MQREHTEAQTHRVAPSNNASARQERERPAYARATACQGGEMRLTGSSVRQGNSLTERSDNVSHNSLTKPPTKRKVLVVHRAYLIRSGVLRLIAKNAQFTVCGETDNAPAARELFVRCQPDLVLLGLTLSGGDGVQLIKDFRNLNRAAATVVLSTRSDELPVQRALRAGARGYLTINDGAPEIVRALEEISKGHLYVSTAVLPLILTNFVAGRRASAGSEMERLSDRELEIFALVGRRFGVSQLARELHLSVKTVETYLMRIQEKLKLSHAADLREKAARWILKCGLEQIVRPPER